MTIQIDKNIPMPTRGKWPFASLEVGDSFFTEEFPSSALHVRIPLKIRSERKFSARTVTENGVKGVRIWRIA